MAEAAKSAPRRTAARAERRAQLIAATMACIARKGISGTTLGDVAREAGLSQGIVNLHFESKDNLLRQTLKFLADEYRSHFERALERAPDEPAASLAALMSVDLSAAVCKPEKLAVWFAFWGEVKSRPTYRAICNEIDRYYDGVVESLCRDIVREGGYERVEAQHVATALTSMTNGLWLSCLLDPQDFDRKAALDSVTAYLATVFPQHFDRSDHA
ncbi:MAG: TetR family transcriptional regulator C-terminal domain-containing protein [Woeseiaceae bacterium]|nr:TetR family transcriptional regulator C-terminal domain-containing protein [Woeseiaceae bacterium]